MEDRLASNPLSSLVEAAPGQRILIRFVNLGFENRSIVFPGLEVDVLGRDARYVPKSAQRLATDTIQIGPGESRDVFLKAPATPGDYPFYDRGLQHYPGNGDGTDAWVGGARSAVRVTANLGAQLKPNGWAGEALWKGEQPIEATPHAAPIVTLQRYSKTTGRNNQRGKYLKGTVTVDATTWLDTLQWASGTGNTPPNPGSNRWRNMPYTDGAPITFDSRVAGLNAGPASYWVRAVDGNGLATISARVRF
jgi:FtsP/CotA-like multicopper oxidase with cupredoxin domain